MVHSEILTRETLLLRLRDQGDQVAWGEFVEIYTPLLYNYCKKRELAHADASDIVQDVMRSVSLAMENFEYDPKKGKFKGWLFTAVRNAISSHFRKKSRRPETVADTLVLESLESDPQEEEAKRWEQDYQNQLMGWALEKIKGEFAERIWSAFKGTALEHRSAEEVGNDLGMSKNAVGVAKHRVMMRLREKVHSIDAGKWEMEVMGRGKR